jgi:hypothetical protein
MPSGFPDAQLANPVNFSKPLAIFAQCVCIFTIPAHPRFMCNAISRKLGEAAWRLRLERLIQVAAWLVAGVLGGVLLWRSLAWMHPAWVRGDVPSLLAVGIGVAALIASASWWNSKSVARELDRRAHTKDRYLSFLALKEQADPIVTPLIEREVSDFSVKLRLEGFFKPRWPVAALGSAMLAGLGLMGLEYFHLQQQATLTTERTEARQLLARATAALASTEKNDPESVELTKELKKTWEKIADSTEPRREAFRSLAALEKNLADAAQASSLTGEEQAALAQALNSQKAQITQSLNQGSGDQAAQQIAALDPDTLAKALEEAARHRESARLRELARQPAAQARQTLVKALRAASVSRRLQQALREAKAGENSSNPNDSMQIAALGDPTDAPPGKENGQPGNLNHVPPGGDPGSEHDQGTGEELGKERDRLSGSASQDETLPSITGGGPSRLAATQLSGNGPGEALRPQTPIDQAAIAAALQEINRENIPPGSQVLVRRYFESIRPKE